MSTERKSRKCLPQAFLSPGTKDSGCTSYTSTLHGKTQLRIFLCMRDCKERIPAERLSATSEILIPARTLLCCFATSVYLLTDTLVPMHRSLSLQCAAEWPLFRRNLGLPKRCAPRARLVCTPHGIPSTTRQVRYARLPIGLAKGKRYGRWSSLGSTEKGSRTRSALCFPRNPLKAVRVMPRVSRRSSFLACTRTGTSRWSRALPGVWEKGWR